MLLIGAAVAGAIALRRPPAPAVPAALPDHGALPGFALTDHRGLPFSRTELHGRVWVVGFIFTRCAGQCPLMTQRMAALRDEPGLHLLSITVDPSHDTPEVLARYAAHQGAPDHWLFVTGDPVAVFDLSHLGFKLAAAEGTTPEEPIAHSTRLVLVDAQGHLRGYYETNEPEAMERLRRDARQLLDGLRP